jgi:hypothetical protein
MAERRGDVQVETSPTGPHPVGHRLDRPHCPKNPVGRGATSGPGGHTSWRSSAAARYPRVLELGCEAGHFTRLLDQLADRIVAFDIAPPAIARARAGGWLYPFLDVA